MPSLHWIGKEKVVNHHHEVPYRVLDHQYSFFGSVGEKKGIEIKTDNKIIHGDNLEALKSLLPEYEGKVKCIYIDVPYNTGNENWVYNDNVNDPRIKKWLHQVVGKEGDDLTRHDKWLCMMYPRLRLLQKLLSNDGSIWVSIDDNAVGWLRPLMDEIFGIQNFVTTVIWEKADSPRNSARQFSTDHDYILVYSKNPEWVPSRLPRTEESNAIYQNQDNDHRGSWIPGDPFANKPYSKGLYSKSGPTGRIFAPPKGRFWRISEEKFDELNADGRIWWGPNGDARPSIKRYLNEVADLVPRTLWGKGEVGSNRTSKNEIRAIFPETSSFDTPKPTALVERVLQIACDKDSIIVDTFAGSGSTAHAVLNLNKSDGGSRKFVLVELEDYANTITAERIKRVINGYGETDGTGGDFNYYELGLPLFDENNNLNEAVDIDKIREYIYYIETKQYLGRDKVESTNESQHFLNLYNGTAYYFNYCKDHLTTLDNAFLSTIRTKADQYVIYADNCLLSKEFMLKKNIIFKKIARDITRF